VLDLLRAAPLIDGHNDLLWELRQGRDPADPTLMTDLPRMAAGGVGGQFWSVYVPSDLPADRAVTTTLEQIDALLDMVATPIGSSSPGRPTTSNGSPRRDGSRR
jgi:membrane dipeptidase